MNRNHARAEYACVAYRVEKSAGECDCLEICCEVDLNIRLEKLLREELGVSRLQAKMLLEKNGFSTNAKLHGNLIFGKGVDIG